MIALLRAAGHVLSIVNSNLSDKHKRVIRPEVGNGPSDVVVGAAIKADGAIRIVSKTRDFVAGFDRIPANGNVVGDVFDLDNGSSKIVEKCL